MNMSISALTTAARDIRRAIIHLFARLSRKGSLKIGHSDEFGR